jgi:RimJ/RimL family protein N-acetyltransferase
LTIDTFATARLVAERLTAAHLPDLRRMDQDVQFMAQLGGVRAEAGTVAYFEHNLAHWDAHGFGLWMLRETHSPAIVGKACVRHLLIEDVDEIEIGYGFFPEYWGRGFATEIAIACVDVARNRLRRPSAVGITLPTNVGSQRVLTRAGLTYERTVQHAGLTHVLFRTHLGR